MIKFLSNFSLYIKEIYEYDYSLQNELNSYMKYWTKYSVINDFSPIYSHNSKISDISCNTHSIVLSSNETVSITWDIDILYKLALNNFS